MIRGYSGSVYVAGLSSPRRADPPSAFLFWIAGRRLRGSISPQAVSAIASAITNQEGFYPGSIAYTNNNPGNLVYAGQPGASPGVGGFASFSTLAQGEAALSNQITLDATRGTDVNGNPTTTISQLIASWAPPAGNNTAAYIQSVASQTGYDPDAPLSSLGTASVFTSPLSAALSPDGSDSSTTGLDLSSLLPDLSAIDTGSIQPWMIGAGLVGLALVARLV